MSYWKIFAAIGCAVFLFLFVGPPPCTESDVPTSSHDSETSITDPSNVRIEAYINREIGYANEVTDEFHVILFDKNNTPTLIKDGGVTVQGFPLKFVNYYSAGTQGYYELSKDSNVGFMVDSTYTVSVYLSNQARYDCSVHTRKSDLNTLVIPSTHRFDTDLTFMWRTADSLYPISATITAFGVSNSYAWQIEVAYPASGQFTIPVEYFRDHAWLTSLDVTIVSKASGAVDSRLRSISTISSSMSIKRKVYRVQ